MNATTSLSLAVAQLEVQIAWQDLEDAIAAHDVTSDAAWRWWRAMRELRDAS